jgi:hypothetical protein
MQAMNTSDQKERSAQVLMDIRHGAHITEDTSPPAVELAATREDITPLKDAVVEPEEVLFETRFDYLFPELATDRRRICRLTIRPRSLPSSRVSRPSAMRWWRIR